MNMNDNKEIQRQALFVQLKILKELRILNKTLTKGVWNLHTKIAPQTVTNGELDDVREALSLTEFNFI